MPSTALSDLKAAYRQCFGLPMPWMMLRDRALVPVHAEIGSGILLGSPSAVRRAFLVQSEIDEFVHSCPQGYFLTGFWGHGVNTYAFYYSRSDSWGRVFFRLPYGGVYSDNGTMGHRVREFFVHYFDFEQKLSGRVKTLLAIDSMSMGRYEIVMRDGRVFELKGSFFQHPQFAKTFGHLLSWDSA